MRLLLLATAALLALSPFSATCSHAQSLPDDTAFDGQSATPAAGSLTVRLNGRFRWMTAEVFDQTFRAAGEKQSSTRIGDYARLYPGFDGVAANGLKYGASFEIRSDSPVAPGGGANGSIGQQDRLRGNLYFWRQWGYLGTPQLGTVRVGSDDSVTSLYLTGVFENFDGGGWNSSELPNLFSTNAKFTWTWADQSAAYTTDKVTYLSPQIFGFDGGISFEPNTGGDSLTNGNCAVAGTSTATSTSTATGCDAASSTSLASEAGRRRNTVDVLLRYRGTFGPVGLAATASYTGGGHVNYIGGPVSSTTAKYDGLSFGDFGAALTYAGFQVGGNIMTGRFNGQYALAPQNTPDSRNWIVGASYTVGPLVVGASYADYQSPGDYGAYVKTGSLRREKGIAAGATYTLAPGVSLYLSYLWSQRHQGGYNFVTSSDSTATTSNNKVRAQALALGTGFSW